MANEISKLPSSSINEIKKIIQGYGISNENATLKEIAKIVSISDTAISSNNGFLVSIGIIQGAKTKTITPLGARLARALEHDQKEDVIICWQEIISNNEFLSNIISTIRIKNGMTLDELVSHILYASGDTKNQKTEIGARSVANIIIESKMVHEENGKIIINKEITQEKPYQKTDQPEQPKDASIEKPLSFEFNKDLKNQKTLPTITISLNLQIPETENITVYENLFKALYENLINPKNNEY